jgi:hypothetical protein
LPTKAPDITATIMAMVAQYESARDRNILFAWKTTGAKFEGKEVHDKDLLAHFKQRIADSAPGDPIRDYWEETLAQYTFHIADDKMKTAYKLGQIKEPAMAAFYRKWAAKTPKDTAAWRSLMQSAGNFEKATRAATGVSKRSLQIKAYEQNMADIKKRDIDPGMKSWSYLVNAAAALSIPIDASTGGMGLDNTANLDDILSSTEANHPDDYQQLMVAMHVAYPGRTNGAPLTSDDVLRGMKRLDRGLSAQIKATRKMGYGTAELEHQRDNVRANITNLKVVKSDLADQYRDAELQYKEDLAAAVGHPDLEVKANEDFANALDPLVDKAGRLGAVTLSGRIYDHARAARGEKPRGPISAGEDWAAPPSTGAPESKDPEEVVEAATKYDSVGVLNDLEATAANAVQARQNYEGMANGTLYQFWDPEQGGHFGYRPVADLPPGWQTRVVKIPDRVTKDKDGNTVLLKGGMGVQAAGPKPVKSTVGALNQAGQVIDPTAVINTGTLYYQLQWGPDSTTNMTSVATGETNPDGTPQIVEMFTSDDVLHAGVDGTIPQLLDDSNGGLVAFYSPDDVTHISSSLVINNQFNAGALLRGGGLSASDLIAGKQVTSTGGVASEGGITTTTYDEKGNPVQTTTRPINTKVGSGEVAGTGQQDPYSFLRDEKGEFKNVGDIFPPGNEQTGAEYYDYVRQRMTLQGVNEADVPAKMREWGLPVPEDFNNDAAKEVVRQQEAAKKPQPAAGAAPVEPTAPADLGGTFGHSTGLDWGMANNVKQSDISLINRWATPTLEAFASSSEKAKELSGLDVAEVFRLDTVTYPSLATDQRLQAEWFKGHDLIRVSGGWKGSEGQYQGAIIARNPLMRGNGFFGGAMRSMGEDVAEQQFVSTLPAQQQAALAGELGVEAQRQAQQMLHNVVQPMERAAFFGADRDIVGEPVRGDDEATASIGGGVPSWMRGTTIQQRIDAFRANEAQTRRDTQVDPDTGDLIMPNLLPGGAPDVVPGQGGPAIPAGMQAQVPQSLTGGAGFTPAAPQIKAGFKPDVPPVAKPPKEPEAQPQTTIKVPTAVTTATTSLIGAGAGGVKPKPQGGYTGIDFTGLSRWGGGGTPQAGRRSGF